MFILGAILFFSLPLDFKWFWILLLAPDISAVGYLLGNKIGAYCYNFFHHKAVAIILILIGYYLNNSIIQGIGFILFAHSSIDRALGYGLKYVTGFKDTHLGRIGKDNNK